MLFLQKYVWFKWNVHKTTLAAYWIYMQITLIKRNIYYSIETREITKHLGVYFRAYPPKTEMVGYTARKGLSDCLG